MIIVRRQSVQDKLSARIPPWIDGESPCCNYSTLLHGYFLYLCIGSDIGYMCTIAKKVKTIPKIEWDKLLRHGVFAALFIMLLTYVMNANDAREKRYLDTIDTLNETINVKLVELKGMHLPRS